MKGAQGFLSRISISRKLLLCGVAAVVIACALVSVYLIHNTAALLEGSMQARADQDIERIQNALGNALSRQNDLLNRVNSYVPLTSYLDMDHNSDYGMYQDYGQLVDLWVQWLRAYESNYEIKVYMPDDYRGISSITNGRLTQLLKTDWFAPEGDVAVGVALSHMVVGPVYADAIVYYRPQWDSSDHTLKRVITVSQSADSLRATVIDDGPEYYLVNPEGRILCSNREETQGLVLTDAVPLPDRADIDAGVVISDGGVPYYVRRAAFRPAGAGLSAGWQILYRQDYSESRGEITRQIISCALMCALIVLAATAWTLLISRSVTSRLKALMRQIDRFGEGQVPQGPLAGTDEIARISRRFDDMARSLNELMARQESTYQRLLAAQKRESELMMSQRDSEYRMLRAQIDPHYLFNTLESLRMSVLLGERREASHIMRVFADSVREYMNVGQLFVPLSEEMRLIGYYVEIQRFRLGDRFVWRADLPEEAMARDIPRLLLQPLVENAINHGIDKKVEGGTVSLTGALQDGWLICKVTDDGAGMDGETLSAVRAALRGDKRADRHLGLWNIDRRLKLLYGEDHGLIIESRPGEGVTVTVAFDLRQGGEREARRDV